MKKLIYILLFILIMTNIIDTFSKDNSFDEMVSKTISSTDSPTIKTLELREEIKNKKVLLIDVREKIEFEVSHIPNAINMSFSNFSLDNLKKRIKKSDNIVVYCSIGYRSGIIADRMLEEGYNVRNYHGGIFDWVNKGFNVESKKQKKEDKIHGLDKDWSKWLKTKLKIVHP